MRLIRFLTLVFLNALAVFVSAGPSRIPGQIKSTLELLNAGKDTRVLGEIINTEKVEVGRPSDRHRS